MLEDGAAELGAEAEKVEPSDNEKAALLLKEAEAMDNLRKVCEVELQEIIDSPKH
jgi:hypothetical protein